MKASLGRLRAHYLDLAGIILGAIALRLISGVGFANYDTLYALAWGGQLSRGVLPAYDVPIAPTPHPLLELLGTILAPLGPHAVATLVVAAAFLALSGCGWVIYQLGSEWFGRAAGALAAVIFLSRVPVLSYGVRAYVDIPYVLLVLGALLCESRSRAREGQPSGVPALSLLALAGLLRPEAWLLSGLYWLYLIDLGPLFGRGPSRDGSGGRMPRWRAPARELSAGELARVTLLAAAGPLVWILSDLLITGEPLWSLTHTRHTASTLDRVTGIANVPEYIPRRIGEVLRPVVLVGAALGGVLSLLWLRRQALLATIVGLVAVAAFVVFASVGLPINTRYAFPTAAILSIFCGAGVFGWTRLPVGDRRRTGWMAAGALVLVGLLVTAPGQYRSAHRELDKLAVQHRIEGDLVALVDNHTISLRCGPVSVPNHAPIPLLALYLKTSPRNIVNAQVGRVATGMYVDPASKEVEDDYVLDRHDPHHAVAIPPGFTEAGTDRSWLIFKRCG
jgi:hypothetical protein